MNDYEALSKLSRSCKERVDKGQENCHLASLGSQFVASICINVESPELTPQPYPSPFHRPMLNPQ